MHYIFKHSMHSVKSVRIRSFSGPCFPTFGLNTDHKNSEYGLFSRSDNFNFLNSCYNIISIFSLNVCILPKFQFHIQESETKHLKSSGKRRASTRFHFWTQRWYLFKALSIMSSNFYWIQTSYKTKNRIQSYFCFKINWVGCNRKPLLKLFISITWKANKFSFWRSKDLLFQ